MPLNASFDLKQVSALFNNCISTARNRHLEDLDATAKTWMQGACHTVMRQLEQKFAHFPTLIPTYDLKIPHFPTLLPSSYWQLARSVESHDPLQLPNYVIDPTSPLIIYLSHSKVLVAYTPAIQKNLAALMQECGFNANVSCYNNGWRANVSYTISIVFPEQIQPRSSSRVRAAVANPGETMASANSALGSFSDSLTLANLRSEPFSLAVALRNPNPASTEQNPNTSEKSRTGRPPTGRGRGRFSKSKPPSANTATAEPSTVGTSTSSRYNTRSKGKGSV